MSKIYLPFDYVNSPCKIVNNNYISLFHNLPPKNRGGKGK